MNNDTRPYSHRDLARMERMRWREMMYHNIFEPRRRERGSLKFIILLMLKDRPMHGYALMKAIEDAYDHPISQGIVYPTLQMLEDQGYVTSAEQDNKKVYSLTPEGQRYLTENQETTDRIKIQQEQPRWRSLPHFQKSFRELAWLIFSNSKDLDPHKLQKIEDILDDTRKRIGKIIFEA